MDFSERENEIGRQENYLKQLERELQNKENEIRTGLNLDKETEEVSIEGRRQRVIKKAR